MASGAEGSRTLDLLNAMHLPACPGRPRTSASVPETSTCRSVPRTVATVRDPSDSHPTATPTHAGLDCQDRQEGQGRQRRYSASFDLEPYTVAFLLSNGLRSGPRRPRLVAEVDAVEPCGVARHVGLEEGVPVGLRDPVHVRLDASLLIPERAASGHAGRAPRRRVLEVLLQLLPEGFLGRRLAVVDELTDRLSELVEGDGTDGCLALRDLIPVDPERDLVLVGRVHREELLAGDLVHLLRLAGSADGAREEQRSERRSGRDRADDPMLSHETSSRLCCRDMFPYVRRASGPLANSRHPAGSGAQNAPRAVLHR